MKYLKSFNESSKSGKMNKKHRIDIMCESNRRINKTLKKWKNTK